MRTAACLAILVAISGTQGCARKVSPEYQQLVGTWVNEPPKQGRGTEHTFHFFNDGTVGWDRFQTNDGEAVAGTKKGYNVQLNPTASPKEITLTREDETRLGIYEVDGDTLKLAIVGSKDRPKNFDEGYILLKRRAQ
jgi:uncharacterized protein (TIGR03067 family)